MALEVSNTGGHGRGDQKGDIIGGVILHDKKQFWGQAGIHYHNGMAAGENTLNALVARVLIRSITKTGGYDPQAFIGDYVKFMTTPGTHNDTYAESYHRDFFKNYSEGVEPMNCAGVEGHNTASMGGMVMIPIVAMKFFCDPSEAKAKAIQHQTLTHRSTKLEQYVKVYVDVLTRVMAEPEHPISADKFRGIIYAACKTIGIDMKKLVEANPERNNLASDVRVIGGTFSPACYIEDSLPSLLFLAAKYADNAEEALLANTNVGGENCHRGFALGALMGAALGREKIPAHLIDGLVAKDELAKEIKDYVDGFSTE